MKVAIEMQRVMLHARDGHKHPIIGLGDQTDQLPVLHSRLAK